MKSSILIMVLATLFSLSSYAARLTVKMNTSREFKAVGVDPFEGKISPAGDKYKLVINLRHVKLNMYADPRIGTNVQIGDLSLSDAAELLRILQGKDQRADRTLVNIDNCVELDFDTVNCDRKNLEVIFP